MTDYIRVIERKHSPSASQTRSNSSIGFDWAVVVLGLWMIGGVHLDAWAHHQFKLETFFTPWHAVLYSGFLALAGVLLGAFVRNIRQGVTTWREALPAGYGLSLVGAAIFMVGTPFLRYFSKNGRAAEAPWSFVPRRGLNDMGGRA